MADYTYRITTARSVETTSSTIAISQDYGTETYSGSNDVGVTFFSSSSQSTNQSEFDSYNQAGNGVTSSGSWETASSVSASITYSSTASDTVSDIAGTTTYITSITRSSIGSNKTASSSSWTHDRWISSTQSQSGRTWYATGDSGTTISTNGSAGTPTVSNNSQGELKTDGVQFNDIVTVVSPATVTVGNTWVNTSLPTTETTTTATQSLTTYFTDDGSGGVTQTDSLTDSIKVVTQATVRSSISTSTSEWTQGSTDVDWTTAIVSVMSVDTAYGRGATASTAFFSDATFSLPTISTIFEQWATLSGITSDSSTTAPGTHSYTLTAQSLASLTATSTTLASVSTTVTTMGVDGANLSTATIESSYATTTLVPDQQIQSFSASATELQYPAFTYPRTSLSSGETALLTEYATFSHSTTTTQCQLGNVVLSWFTFEASPVAIGIDPLTISTSSTVLIDDLGALQGRTTYSTAASRDYQNTYYTSDIPSTDGSAFFGGAPVGSGVFLLNDYRPDSRAVQPSTDMAVGIGIGLTGFPSTFFAGGLDQEDLVLASSVGNSVVFKQRASSTGSSITDTASSASTTYYSHSGSMDSGSLSSYEAWITNVDGATVVSKGSNASTTYQWSTLISDNTGTHWTDVDFAGTSATIHRNPGGSVSGLYQLDGVNAVSSYDNDGSFLGSTLETEFIQKTLAASNMIVVKKLPFYQATN